MESNRWDTKRQKLQRARHSPERSALYRLIYHYRDQLEWAWADQFQSEYGALRNEVLDSLDKFLDCGILIHGCARAVCEDCGHSELIAFSCKRRGICTSCDAKRAVIFAEHLNGSVLSPFPISHQVYTIPKRLRPYFKFNRTLNKHPYHAAWGAWQDLLDDEFPDCRGGAVMALHTAGELLNFHPHPHALMLHGAVDGAGNFHRLDSIQTEYLTRCFQRRILEALQGEHLIDKEAVNSMLAWENSGFHVFVGDPIEPADQEARLFVARYLRKSPISHKRLELIENGNEPIVRYRSFNEALPEHRDFSPLSFLAALSSHIPDTFEQTVRYMGVLSARSRGAAREIISIGPLPASDPAAKPSRTWAQCMKRIFEIDPLACPKCNGQMHIKAFILNGTEIERLSKNLGIVAWRAPPPLKSVPSSLAA